MLEKFESKKIIILGFGREGIDSFLFFKKLFPKMILAIGDRQEFKELGTEAKKAINKNKKSIILHLGKNYLKPLKNYEIIVKSPGIPLKNIKSFLKRGQVVSSQTKIFFDNCPGTIIGVTGTKGKSTVSSLVYQILKKARLKAHLVGNIGEPALPFLFKATAGDIYVYELSSHQLSGLGKSPQVAVFLNLYPEHLDYYKNFKEYSRAKANICLYQKKGDYLIFNPENKTVAGFSAKSKAFKLKINPGQVKRLISEKDNPLIGDFNLYNISAAVNVSKIFDIGDETIKEAVKSFKPLPHRLEPVGKYKGISFYNDSLATLPEATISAIDAIGPGLETLISGGFDRGLSFAKLGEKILKSRIKTLILFPTTGAKIKKAVEKAAVGAKKPLPRMFFSGNMASAVKSAYQNTGSGKICLLSCASASFNMFKDYQDRGNQFKKNVKKSGSR